jgi:integrase
MTVRVAGRRARRVVTVRCDVAARAWLGSRAYMAARTVDTDESVWRRLVAPTFADRPVARMTAAEIQDWLGRLALDGVPASTLRRALAVLRGVLGYAVAAGWIGESPAAAVRPPRGRARREGRPVTVAQVAELVAAVPVGCAPVVACLAFAGLRFSEMAALTVGDVIDTAHGLGLRVHRALTQRNGGGTAVFGDTKSHQARTVPVPDVLVAYVVAARRRASDVPLFPTGHGGHWTNTNFRARTDWTTTAGRLGLTGVRIHDLRHTAATLVLASGADLKSVARILGHASVVMTGDLYGHVIDAQVFRAARSLQTGEVAVIA